jgi:hypothetical protein
MTVRSAEQFYGEDVPRFLYRTAGPVEQFLINLQRRRNGKAPFR